MKPGIRLRIAISVYTPPAFDAPRRNIAMPFGVEKKTTEWFGDPIVKMLKIYLFVLTEFTNVTDTA